jgi:hypothetical protein
MTLASEATAVSELVRVIANQDETDRVARARDALLRLRQVRHAATTTTTTAKANKQHPTFQPYRSASDHSESERVTG